ncbi:MAG: hypothetical protein EP344_05750, partial [Bacteroidetes bacterium]
MIPSCFQQTGFFPFLVFFLVGATALHAQPCPTLDQTATLTSPDCAPGSDPCALCPGESFTLNATGTNLIPGSCINWYYGTNNTFNPYNGEGVLLGCATVAGAPPPAHIPPFSFEITADMCNGGPYWVVGIVDPLNNNCSPTFTNYLQFDVICPTPVLDSAAVCHNGGLYDLTQLQDPTLPDGIWSGPGVSGSNFNPAGLFGPQVLTFTPSADCGVAVSTIVTVYPAPTATFSPVQPVCPGQPAELFITLSGQAPWSFDLYAGNTLLNSYTVQATPLTLQVSPLATTTYSIQNLTDSLCQGPNATVDVEVTPPPAGVLTLAGPDTICAGKQDTLLLQVSGGAPPYSFVYSINGLLLPSMTTNQDSFVFLTPTLFAGTSVIRLDSVTANGCLGVVSGLDTL